MSEGKRTPAFNIRLSYRDGREQEFQSFSGKDIKSKWRNIGAAWPGKYEETPYSISLEKGTKIVLADGTEYEVDEIYLDLRKPYDASQGKGSAKPAGKTEAKKAEPKKRKAVTTEDPFA